MYVKKENHEQLLLPDDFFLPFGGKLNKENRWVALAGMILRPRWKRNIQSPLKDRLKGKKQYPFVWR